jgi:hypothetical protein
MSSVLTIADGTACYVVEARLGGRYQHADNGSNFLEGAR